MKKSIREHKFKRTLYGLRTTRKRVLENTTELTRIESIKKIKKLCKTTRNFSKSWILDGYYKDDKNILEKFLIILEKDIENISPSNISQEPYI